jgi:DNA repair exonuclease SbcCD ATPase subunit
MHAPKLKSITLSGFRAFATEKKVDLDADLVVIAGPNGVGKSSLLDAILLAISGHSVVPADAIPHVYGTAPDAASEPTSWSVKPTWTDQPPQPSLAQITPETLRDPSRGDWRQVCKGTDANSERELVAHLSAYFPDRELAPGQGRAVVPPQELIRRLLDPETIGITECKALLEERIAEATKRAEEAKREIKRVQANAPEIAALRAACWQDHTPFFEALRQARDLPPTAPSPVEPGLSVTEALGRWSMAFGVAASTPWGPHQLGDLKRSALRQLRREIDEERTRARRVDRPDEQRKLDVVQAQLKDAFAEHPHLDEDLRWMCPFGKDGPTMGALVRALTEAQRSAPHLLKPWVRDELALVNPQRGSLAADDLDGVLGILQKARLHRTHLEAQRDELEKELSKTTSERVRMLEKLFKDADDAALWDDPRWKRLGKADEDQAHLPLWQEEARTQPQRARAWTVLRDAVDEAGSSLSKAHVTRPTIDAINEVLRSFAFSGEFLPLSEAPNDDLRTQDGRLLGHLSAGQRAQVQVGILLALQSLAVQHRSDFPHRCLLLDDASTAYDLSNLSREALIWRQLAYHPDPAQRRQVILSSHHEELTHHMLDLLCPPPRFPGMKGEAPRMRLIRFTGWSAEKGPIIEEMNVVSAAQIVHPDTLARRLQEELCPSR